MITKTDIENYKKLGLVLSKGSFELKGDAIISVALLIKWYNGLLPVLDKINSEYETKSLLSNAETTPIKKGKKK